MNMKTRMKTNDQITIVYTIIEIVMINRQCSNNLMNEKVKRGYWEVKRRVDGSLISYQEGIMRGIAIPMIREKIQSILFDYQNPQNFLQNPNKFKFKREGDKKEKKLLTNALSRFEMTKSKRSIPKIYPNFHFSTL